MNAASWSSHGWSVRSLYGKNRSKVVQSRASARSLRSLGGSAVAGSMVAVLSLVLVDSAVLTGVCVMSGEALRGAGGLSASSIAGSVCSVAGVVVCGCHAVVADAKRGRAVRMTAMWSPGSQCAL